MPKEELTKISEDEFQAVAQWLFVHTIDDLRSRIEKPEIAGDRYQMLGIAPLLRKLLLDGGNLVQAVNRRYRLQITFQIAPFAMDDREIHDKITEHIPPPVPSLDDLGYWRIFSPGSLIPTAENPGESLGLAHFLASHLGVVNRHRLTVKELIQFYCIVEGGVHIGMPRRPHERDLLSMVPSELTMPHYGVDNSPISSLYVCAEIILEALEPLLEAIGKDPVEVSAKPDMLAASQGAPRHWRG